jgi:NADH:ubiquinone oxidoreductase subunit F (NADH-binding)
MALQASKGAVSDADLEALAHSEGVPLYRLEGLRSFYPVFREQAGAPVQVQVCRDVVCRMAGGDRHCASIRNALSDSDSIEVSEVSCIGLCDQAPAAMINDSPVGGTVDEIRDYATGARALPEAGSQVRSWPTNPYESVHTHYDGFRRLLADKNPDAIIQTLKDAGLRGLGGAAFPTHLKWDFTRKAAGAEKFVICNADESEPGTFKDRLLLEQLPHLVIEGMLTGAWVVGAQSGIIYLRHEYVLGAQALERAIADAYAMGALGENIFGSGFSFDLEVFISPGGYILGEETALLEALEDQRGEPRNKPPFPTNAGLHGKPTLINNVETFAAVPAICLRGADWWAEQGKPGFKGLKYVSVSGDVVRPGVHCVPWGSTAREVLELCGGMADGRALKAFSPGGASTPFLPADKLDTPLDFDAMQAAGSALGTGAMVFVAEHRDLLDVAMAQVRFFRNESCGKCVPCRVGSQKAVEMVEQLLAGEAAQVPLDLAELHDTLVRTSICGLGQVALLPLVDALKKFPDDPSLTRILQGERS